MTEQPTTIAGTIGKRVGQKCIDFDRSVLNRIETDLSKSHRGSRSAQLHSGCVSRDPDPGYGYASEDRSNGANPIRKPQSRRRSRGSTRKAIS